MAEADKQNLWIKTHLVNVVQHLAFACVVLPCGAATRLFDSLSNRIEICYTFDNLLLSG
jgi:hypothetical protein